MTTKIEKITLNIGRKTVELSVEEAKELKAVLSTLFGADKVKYVTKEVHHDHYPYRPYYPYYWYGTTCGNSISLSVGEAPKQSGTSAAEWLAEMQKTITF